MPHLFRYYRKHRPTGDVSDGVLGFRSTAEANKQLLAWTSKDYCFWMEPQVGIELPSKLAHDDDKVSAMTQAGARHTVFYPVIYHLPKDVDRWRYLFEQHGYDFNESRLAPSRPSQPSVEQAIAGLHLVSGRVCGDDDTALIVEAQSLGDAESAYMARMRSDAEVDESVEVFIVSSMDLSQAIRERVVVSNESAPAPDCDEDAPSP